jgi:Uma2 family endonuclease
MNADALARKPSSSYGGPAHERLPTMYDLPSEFPEEPGLPDVYHIHQPDLLSQTFRPPAYPWQRVFCASDLNIYYDPNNPIWHKRPDWFGVVGVNYLYGEEEEMRHSYVVWQERVSPVLIVELLSDATVEEDQGVARAKPGGPATKWDVYERILQVPYYVVYGRKHREVSVYRHNGQKYLPAPFENDRFWMPEIKLGLGLWQGVFKNIKHPWLRFFDEQGQWLPTPEEQQRDRADREKARADREKARADRLAAKLRALGIQP